MQIQQKFVRELDSKGFLITKLTHVKAMKDGKYVKFAKHTEKLLGYLQTTIIEVPDEVVE